MEIKIGIFSIENFQQKKLENLIGKKKKTENSTILENTVIYNEENIKK